jgi:hypothetical protein
MAELNNPTEAEVLALARAADEGVDYTPAPVASVETSGTESETASGDNSEQPATPETTEIKSTSNDAVTDEVQETETVSTKSSLTEQSDEPKSESASEKKQSKYQKAQSRLAKEWDDVKAERARLQAEREALDAAKTTKASQVSPEAETKGNSRKFSAEDYREAAKSYRDEGRDDLAKLAENKASEIEVEDKRAFEHKVQTEMKSAWDKNLMEEVDSNPELKDSSTPLYKAVSQLLQQHAILRNYPAGIKDAVGLAKMHLKAEAASGLEKKIAQYESELTRLRKATTPANSQPSAPARQKQFHEMSSKEQEMELLKMAAEADRA